MIKRILFFTLMVVIMAACANKKAAGTKDQNKFGDSITAKGAVSYPEFMAKFASVEKMDAKIKGTVLAVCQNKGCWMTISDGQEAAPIFVKFKDYGFFMPMDIAGREIIMEGNAFREMTTVDELKHMAEDAGKPQEEIDAITQPKNELKFMANGVILLPAKK